jgi:hypothetical protein
MSPIELAKTEQHLRLLGNNYVWTKHVLPELQKLEKEMLAGLTDTKKSMEERNQFLQGFLKASEFTQIVPSLIQRVENEKKEMEDSGVDLPDEDET